MFKKKFKELPWLLQVVMVAVPCYLLFINGAQDLVDHKSAGQVLKGILSILSMLAFLFIVRDSLKKDQPDYPEK